MTESDYLDIKEAKKRWLDSFAPDVFPQIRGEIHADEFLWHLCSYEKIYCLKGNEAVKKFNGIERKRLIMFSEDDFDYDFVKEIPSDCKGEEFEDMEDIYVCDSEFRWCFIHTHAENCGPYFVERKREI